MTVDSLRGPRVAGRLKINPIVIQYIPVDISIARGFMGIGKEDTDFDSIYGLERCVES